MSETKAYKKGLAGEIPTDEEQKSETFKREWEQGMRERWKRLLAEKNDRKPKEQKTKEAEPVTDACLGECFEISDEWMVGGMVGISTKGAKNPLIWTSVGKYPFAMPAFATWAMTKEERGKLADYAISLWEEYKERD